MIDATIEHELSTCLNKLPLEQQQRVLEFARTLIAPALQGVCGSTLLQFAGKIDPVDLDLMSQAIEQGCEKVDTNEW